MKLRRARTFVLLRALLYLAFLVLTLVALRRVAVVIAPVATGLFLAYLLNPMVQRLERRRMPRSVAVALLVLAVLLGLAAIAVLLPPLLSSEIERFAAQWHAAQERIQTVLLPWARKTLHLSRSASAEEMLQKAIARVDSLFDTASLNATDALTSAFRTATGVLRMLLAALLIPVFAIYFLSDFPHLDAGARALVPPRYREHVFPLLAEINHALASWLRGQLTVMLVLGALYATGLAITGLPLGVAIGLLTGLMAFVPYVGVFVGLALALAVAMLDAHPASSLLGVFVTFAAVQALDGFLVTPRILGGRVGISPVWVIFALTLGGELLGYAGVLLAVPAAAIVNVLLRHAQRRYLESPFYTGVAAMHEPALPTLAARTITPSDESARSAQGG